METKQKKRFFSKHSRSSAAVVSIALHLILLVIAGTFVAVQVVVKSEQKFESRQINRPRMPPKKLQVPVKIKKQKRKPKLRQRIVVKAKARSMPDIKMPEISGIKGGLGAAGSAGLEGVGGIGFSMPEIEVFGVRSKGEKVFLALDSDAIMMRNEIGGMHAYAIIKDELKKIIDGLGPTTLFNIAVFEHNSTTMFFPQMVPASRENVTRVGKWLDPLNKVSAGMSDDAYGPDTLGPGGTACFDDFEGGELRPVEGSNVARYWYTPAALAMRQQADTVFILTGGWGTMRYAKGKTPDWPEAKRKRWKKCVREGRKLLEEENEELIAKGEPPRVIGGDYEIVREYFPSQYESLRQPLPELYHYTARDFSKSLHLFRQENAPKLPSKSGLSKRKKDSFSVNVVFFARVGGLDEQKNDIERFDSFADLCNGEFRSITGLKAIKSSVSGE